MILLFAIGSARAEVVRVGTAAPLYANPGEQETVVSKVTAGESVEVLGKKGRWLKVKNGPRTGWMMRTSLSADEKVVASPTTKSRWRAPPTLANRLVLEDATHVYRAPEAKAEERILSGGSIVYVVGERRQDGWLLVLDEKDRAGWVHLAAEPPTQETLSSPQTPLPNQASRIAFLVGGTVGARSFSRLSTEEDSQSGELALGALRLGARVHWKRVFFSGALRYAFGSGAPGIADEMTGETVPFSVREIDGNVGVGAQWKRIIGALHAGARHSFFGVSALVNDAKLGRESLWGPTTGIAIECRVFGKTNLAIGADWLFPAGFAQTQGLEDGAPRTQVQATGLAELRIPLAADLLLTAGYELGWSRLSFTGASMRHDAMDTVRTEVWHGLALGLEKSVW